MIHGIYAGDIYQLSSKVLLPYLYWLGSTYGSFSRGLLDVYWKTSTGKSKVIQPFDHRLERELAAAVAHADPFIQERLNEIKKASVYTFKGGLEQLPLRLVHELKSDPAVSLRRNVRLEDISIQPDKRVRQRT